jgi:hypothetical protein
MNTLTDKARAPVPPGETRNRYRSLRGTTKIVHVCPMNQKKNEGEKHERYCTVRNEDDKISHTEDG